MTLYRLSFTIEAPDDAEAIRRLRRMVRDTPAAELAERAQVEEVIGDPIGIYELTLDQVRARLKDVVEAVQPYASADQHATPRGTRSAVKRAVAAARRVLGGQPEATCGNEHKGFRCGRPLYHPGKHRHSARLEAA